jgi:hypothetical protein
VLVFNLASATSSCKIIAVIISRIENMKMETVNLHNLGLNEALAKAESGLGY